MINKSCGAAQLLGGGRSVYSDRFLKTDAFVGVLPIPRQKSGHVWNVSDMASMKSSTSLFYWSTRFQTSGCRFLLPYYKLHLKRWYAVGTEIHNTEVLLGLYRYCMWLVEDILNVVTRCFRSILVHDDQSLLFSCSADLPR